MIIKDTESILKTRPFEVEKFSFYSDEKGLSLPYYRLLCPDWVNVLPITDSGEALLIKQMRAGAQQTILETPGGVVDAEEKNDPTITAHRELEEETGFSSKKMIYLGSVNPNPAIQNNRVHFFIAFGCSPTQNRVHFPDQDEEIETQLVKAEELDELVRLGRIDHALSALCILLAGKYLNISSKSPLKSL